MNINLKQPGPISALNNVNVGYGCWCRILETKFVDDKFQMLSTDVQD